MTKKTIYVAGPMTGYDNLNFEAFNFFAENLRADGWKVHNPAEINPDLDADWADCMIEDIQYVVNSDAIFMLRGWEKSKGATVEWIVANALGLEIYYEDDDVARKPNYPSGADGKAQPT